MDHPPTGLRAVTETEPPVLEVDTAALTEVCLRLTTTPPGGESHLPDVWTTNDQSPDQQSRPHRAALFLVDSCVRLPAATNTEPTATMIPKQRPAEGDPRQQAAIAARLSSLFAAHHDTAASKDDPGVTIPVQRATGVELPEDVIQHSDQELIDAIQAGDKTAFDLLHRRYWQFLVSYLDRMASDPDLAEDTAQETLLRAYIAISGGNVIARNNAGEVTLRSWLVSVGSNWLRDHWKSSAYTTTSPSGDLSMLERTGHSPVWQTPEDAYDAIADAEAKAALIAALVAAFEHLQQTKQRFATAVWCRIGLGYSVADTMPIAVMSNPMVRKATHESLKRLREYMESAVAAEELRAS